MKSSAMKSSLTCLVLNRKRKWNSHKNKNSTQEKEHEKQMTWKRDREKENQTWICARSSCIRFQLSAYCRLPFEKVISVNIVIFVTFAAFVTFVTFVTFVSTSLNVSEWKKPQYQWSDTMVSGSDSQRLETWELTSRWISLYNNSSQQIPSLPIQILSIV